MMVSVTSPWIVETFAPAPPIEEQAVAKILNFKDKLARGLKGEQIESAKSEFSFISILNLIVVLFGAIAVVLGIIGFVKKENFRMSSAAITVGASAILFQYFLMLAAAILVIAIVVAFIQNGGL
jgi:hypothetical protein